MHSFYGEAVPAVCAGVDKQVDLAAGRARRNFIATLLESVFIFHSEYEGQSDQRPNSAHLLQQCGLRIISPGDLLDFVILSWIFSVSDSTSFSHGSNTCRTFGGRDSIFGTPI